MKTKKIIAFISAAVLAVSMTACSNSERTHDGGEITSADLSQLQTELVTGTSDVSDALDDETADVNDIPEVKLITDREGNIIQVPESIETIVSTAPSITEILKGLGMADKITAADLYSSDIEGIDPAICTIDFYNLNIEELAAIAPDVIVISGMSMAGADNPYAALKDAGINVIYVPTSETIEDVKLDIEFLAAYMDAEEKGAELVADIDAAVADISAKAASVTEKKTVYFEIGAAPYLYSCGSGTFIDEIISLVGAENIYAAESGWLSNSEESVIAADPDIIISNVAYDGYDFNEIKTRVGWDNIKAVKNGDVYYVDSNSVSRPSQYIVDGMYAVAKAIYPDIFS